jgi:hypothetical protein
MRRGASLALLCLLACTPTPVDPDAAVPDAAVPDAPVDPDVGPDAPAIDAATGPFEHEPIADGITGPLGTVMPLATTEQRTAFDRGRAVFVRVRQISDGLGPEFSGVSCAHCHERPTVGGGASLYRNTYLSGAETMPGVFRLSSFHLESEDTGSSAGVVRLYRIPGPGQAHARSPLPADASRLVARNPTPLYAAGPIGVVDDEAILALADPDDADGDGISGRPNYELGHVGRYGTQAIAAGLEDFMRVEIFLSLGLSVQLLDATRLAALPFPDRSDPAGTVFVADPADGVSDPEMSADELFDLMSFVQLLAGPPLDPLDARSAHGRDVFDALRCASCHRPRMPSPLGPLPLYSDLLLHDMGADLASGLDILDASQSEFRTTSLWGVGRWARICTTGAHRASTRPSACTAGKRPRSETHTSPRPTTIAMHSSRSSRRWAAPISSRPVWSHRARRCCPRERSARRCRVSMRARWRHSRSVARSSIASSAPARASGRRSSTVTRAARVTSIP